MILGFTGTKQGMTPEQRTSVRNLLVMLVAKRLHHGVCIGADADAHGIALAMKLQIVGHPPLDASRMADLAGFWEMWKPLPYLVRNKHIIEQSTGGVVACPRGFIEPSSLRGEGTWTTIGYARKARRRLWIVKPDGVIAEER